MWITAFPICGINGRADEWRLEQIAPHVEPKHLDFEGAARRVGPREAYIVVRMRTAAFY